MSVYMDLGVRDRYRMQVNAPASVEKGLSMKIKNKRISCMV